MNDITIRWMIRLDVPDVMRIELVSFPVPWTEGELIDCLSQCRHIGMVAEQGDTILGFMVYELQEESLSLLNFAVDPRYRRRRIGKRMVEKLIRKLDQQRRQQIILAVRETNLPAQLFFRSCGFKAAGVFRHYYDDTDEDAYAMRYVLPSDCDCDCDCGPVTINARLVP